MDLKLIKFLTLNNANSLNSFLTEEEQYWNLVLSSHTYPLYCRGMKMDLFQATIKKCILKRKSLK